MRGLHSRKGEEDISLENRQDISSSTFLKDYATLHSISAQNFHSMGSILSGPLIVPCSFHPTGYHGHLLVQRNYAVRHSLQTSFALRIFNNFSLPCTFYAWYLPERLTLDAELHLVFFVCSFTPLLVPASFSSF